MCAQGKLFVVEGPDGVGKSTLAQALVNHLTAHQQPCDYLAFPGRQEGTLGKHVYELHHDLDRFGIGAVHPLSLQMLHVAAHIDAIEHTIYPTLKAGSWIIMDRFWWSTRVYGLVNGIDPVPLKALLSVEEYFWQKLQPTIAFLVQRTTPLREEPLEQWHKLSAAYYELAQEQQQHYPVRMIRNEHALDVALHEMLSAIANVDDHSPAPSPSHTKAQNSRQSGVPTGTQLAPKLVDSREPNEPHEPYPTIFTRLDPAKPTEVFDTYWRFAAERQAIFFRRVAGISPPWTDDPILAMYKFTNAYRASDRVSQYLIRHVIYQGDQAPEEVFFRTILFKIFNSVKTWDLLTQAFGAITYADYDFERYDVVLSRALEEGTTIFSGAYIMPSGGSSFGFGKKHRNYLALLERMLEDEVPQRITELRSMRHVFELLRSYPMMGDFLAYQYVIDLNYSELTNFSEMEFVVPGPGARDGIRKCFTELGGLSEPDIIRLMAEQQEAEWSRLGLHFRSLWGRPLQLIDCQNLFCEVDKYARVAHPQIQGLSGRQRIKQRYQPAPRPIQCWYPPKWSINALIPNSVNGEQNDVSI